MPKIKIEKISEQKLKEMDIFSWPIWEKEVSRFDWHYDETEMCYLLKGKVTVETKDGEKVSFGACLLYTSPSPRDQRGSRMPSSA